MFAYLNDFSQRHFEEFFHDRNFKSKHSVFQPADVTIAVLVDGHADLTKLNKCKTEVFK